MNPTLASPWFAAVACILPAVACAADPIQCPIGTRHVAPVEVSSEVRAEICVDVLGRKQGPIRLWLGRDGTLVGEGVYRDGFLDGVMRNYDASGVLIGESLYATGALIAFKPTLAALQTALDRANADARADGKNRTIVLLDRHTIAIEYVKKPPLSFLFAATGKDYFTDEMRRKLASDPRFCRLFQQMSRLPGLPIHRMRMRWIDDSGKLLHEMWLQEEECGDQADP